MTAIDPPVLRRPNTVAAVMLTEDLTTVWGTYARGMTVDIESSSDCEHVIVLADLLRIRLLAKVPHAAVRRAADLPPRTRQSRGTAVVAPHIANTWSEGAAA